MAAPDTTLTLIATDVAATVHQAFGARIGQITVAGQPLFVDVPSGARDGSGRDGSGGDGSMMWGSFAMVPWVGRIRNGRFAFGGVERQLAINHHDGAGDERAHAIHGLTFDRPWPGVSSTATSCTSSIGLDWEFGGTVTQHVELHDDSVEVTLTVESDGSTFPAEVGWHPWFRKPDRLTFTPTAMYERDTVGIPTGALVTPTTGPWDDCFVNTDAVVLEYDRPSAAAVTIESDAGHWVVYDHPADATCVEPQSGPPDAFNLSPHLVEAATPLRRTMTIRW